MAQQVKVILVDDIDGGEAVETLSFSLEGVAYEIDLSETNADRFRDAVAPFVGAARKSGRARSNGTRARSNGSRVAAGERGGRAADIRAWARSQSIEVNERGRIPARVVEQYDAAH